MKLKIEINCDNAAFFDENEVRDNTEICRILECIIFSLKSYRNDKENSFSDINGNKVGFYQFTDVKPGTINGIIKELSE